MFTPSEPLLLFDYFRVPAVEPETQRSVGGLASQASDVSMLGSVRPTSDDSRALFWVPASSEANGHVSGAFKADSIPIFGGLLPDAAAKEKLASIGGTWHRSRPIYDLQGTWIASIWASTDGIFLPFDPNEVIERFWSESYAEFVGSGLTKAIRSSARRSYYRLRSGIPAGARILVRRWFSRVQSRTSFPRWPIETALHDFYALLFDLLADVAGEPIPTIAPWPQGYEWALVLTHDVETVAGYDNIALLCDI